MPDGVIPLAKRARELGVEIEVPPAAGQVGAAAGGERGGIGNRDKDQVGDAQAVVSEQQAGGGELGAPLAAAGMPGPP